MIARRFTVATLASLCALTGALALSSAPALAARGHVFGKSFGEKGSGPGQLSEPSGVAVNEATGDVYVVDQGNNRVEQFGSEGAYKGEFNGSGLLPSEGVAAGGRPGETLTGRLSAPEAIAVDNSTNASDPSVGDVYVVDAGHTAIDKFSATGAYIGQILATPGRAFEEFKGVAVDPAGRLWLYDDYAEAGVPERGAESFSNAEKNVLEAFHKMKVIGVFATRQFAVDPEGRLYGGVGGVIARFSSAGEERFSTEAFDLEPASAVAIETSTADPYIDNISSVARFSSAGALIERFGSEPGPHHLVQGSGLAVNSATGRVYVADASSDVIDEYPLEPASRPTVEAESVTAVTATSATLAAKVNPRSESAEDPTSYRFEYGPCATPATCATSPYLPLPGGKLLPDYELHTVTAHVQGLLPHTAYHFRVVASNANGVTEGERSQAGEEVPHSFTTQGTGAFALPDAREWELVSPPDKHGALIEPIAETNVIQASSVGGALTYVASVPVEEGAKGYFEGAQVISTRGISGWSSQDVSLAHATPPGLSAGYGHEYRAFTAELSVALVEPLGEYTSLAPEASPPDSERTPYVRHDSTCSSTPASCYQPLVTSAPGYADVPEGTRFGGEPKPGVGLIHGEVNFVGASPDLSHVVVSSKVALTKNAVGGPEALYEFSAGRPPAEELELVSILPGSAGQAGAITQLGLGNTIARNAVSEDGSRIVFSEVEGHLYMRDTAGKGQTVQLDLPRGVAPSGVPAPRFQIASRDGSRVFFTDSQRLTEDSRASQEHPEKPDLYECHMVEVEGELQCKLSDLTPGSGEEAADVQGAVIGASEDGSWVYYVANGVLAAHATPGRCEQSSPPFGATCNLYVSHLNGESWEAPRLVAALSGEDYPDWTGAGGHDLSKLTARVSPDGQWLAFMSQASLTGYDNRDALSGKPDEEVYLYDATKAASATNPVCASCDPTGARPVGVEYKQLNDRLVGGDRVWGESQWIAANVPGWTPYAGGRALYQSRYLSDEGRLFFNSGDALASQDVNHNQDVYEFEPAGVGGCSSSSSTFDGVSGGCLALISSGRAAGESAFLDASENGNDVYFLTGERLVSGDTDTALDVYDAHVCVSAAPCFSVAASPPPCATVAACRPAPISQPQIFGPPASATLSGAGNPTPPSVKRKSAAQLRAVKLSAALRACRRLKGRNRRVSCERNARKRLGPARSSKARAGKGGGR